MYDNSNEALASERDIPKEIPRQRVEVIEAARKLCNQTIYIINPERAHTPVPIQSPEVSITEYPVDQSIQDEVYRQARSIDEINRSVRAAE